MEPDTDTAPGEFIKTPRDYLALLRRRRLLLCGVGAAVFVIGIAVAILMPPIYRSMATILIEEPEVPPDLIESTVTSYADQRIQMIKYRIMTSRNLTDIINRFGLYRDLRRDTPLQEVIDEFRDDVEVETIEARVLNPRNGQPTRATIAFTLSYKNPTPRKAQQVTNELVTLYLAENTRERQNQAAATTKFMTQESERLAARIKELEARIADFKQRHAGRLPQQLETNLLIIDRVERDRAQVERRIRGLKERQIFLKSELEAAAANATSEDEAGTPRQRLAHLLERLASLRKTLGPNHPQLISLKNEIEALKSSLDSTPRPGAVSAMSSGHSVRLAVLREEELPKPDEVFPVSRINVQLRSELQAINVELAALEAEQQSLTDRIKTYEQRVMETPEVERAYQALIRDYDNARKKYHETKDKQMAAELSQALETERKSERFVLLEPPQLPTVTTGPGKWLIVLSGFMLAMVSGVGMVLFTDMFDNRIHGSRQLAALTGESPLQVIPYIQTPWEHWRIVALRVFLSAFTVAAIAGALAGVHYMVMPLDMLAFKVMSMARAAIHLPQL